jgi:hypothetical protein
MLVLALTLTFKGVPMTAVAVVVTVAVVVVAAVVVTDVDSPPPPLGVLGMSAILLTLLSMLLTENVRESRCGLLLELKPIPNPIGMVMDMPHGSELGRDDLPGHSDRLGAMAFDEFVSCRFNAGNACE